MADVEHSHIIHIFDAIARDQRVISATEDTMEVEYLSANDSDGDSIVQGHSRGKPSGKLQNRELVIHLFGSKADGTPVRVEVTGFKPFFFVELPEGNLTELNASRKKIEETLRSKLGKAADEIETRILRRQKLFGYTGGRQYPFLQLTMKSMGAFYNTRKVFLSDRALPLLKLNGYPVKVYESNIDPMLRFFHIRNLQPCGWVCVKGSVMEDEGESSTITIQATWDEIDPAQPPIVTAPFYHAFWDIETYSHDGEFPVPTQGYRRVAKQLVAACSGPEEIYDEIVAAFCNPGSSKIRIPPLLKPSLAPKRKEVEACLNRVKGEFAVAWEKDRTNSLEKILDSSLNKIAPLAGDPIIQIGTTAWRYGSPQAERHMFVQGGCADVPGVIIHRCADEKELILAWCEWCCQENFDVFVGYNIFGFDEKYVWYRLCELGLEQEETVQRLTRLFDQGGEFKLEEKRLASAALGDNMLYMWTTPGRLRIDLLGHVRRKAQMPSYKLDDVAAAFLSGKLGGVAPASDGKWLLRTKQKGDARVGRYVKVLDEMGEELTDKMRIYAVTDSGIEVETDEELGAIAGEAAKWAVVKDDLPPREMFECHRGTDADRAKIAAYCAQDCDLVLELYKKLEVLNEAMSMANVCSVPVSYIFVRGQGIKIESLIFKDCMSVGQLIEVLPGGDADGDSYEGAIVLDPIPGFYTDAPVGVCDFASLYPSTIISENISHDMLVWVKDYDLEGRLLCVKYGSEAAQGNAPAGTRFTDIEFDIWRPDASDTRKNPEKKRVGVRLCRYAQPPGDVKGSLPTIVAKLLAARKAKRNEMAKTDDPFKKALLDAEQNAYKVTANSLYGQLGSGTFKIRLQHLAASVTSYGRKQILFAKAAIEKFYGPDAKDPRCVVQTVYGDTDSIFVNFNPRNPVTGQRLQGREAIVATIELTEEAGKFVTAALKAPHDFEYDKVFYPFIIFSKKRYVGNKYEENPDEFKETSMGIVLKRRDNAPLLKMCYGAAIDRLLNHRDVPGAMECVKEKVRELVEGKMKLSQLTITKSLRSEYAGTPPAHKMLAMRIAERDPGNAPASGERIGYVYIQPPIGQQASKLQGDRVETPSFIQEKGLKPDAEYYIDHQLYNPLTELFGIMVDKMPGFTPPRQWATDPDKLVAQKETLAGDILFKEGLALCKRDAKRNFMTAMFGVQTAAAPRASSTSTSVPASQPIAKPTSSLIEKSIPASVIAKANAQEPQKKQATLFSYMKEVALIEDQMLAQTMRKAKTSAKNTAKGATKAKGVKEKSEEK